MEFPLPFVLGLDNSTAIHFANGTATKTKLKHIDARQQWVQILRNKSLMRAGHVPTKENRADLGTKIHSPRDFIRLRDMMMQLL